MSSDISSWYDRVVNIAASAPTVFAGMNTLLDYCSQVFPSPIWEDLRGLNYDADEPRLRDWLEYLFTQEPPASNISTLWFGLYEAVDEEGTTYILYLSGSVQKYTPDSLDWACWTKETYLPDHRYANSEILPALFRAGQSEPEAALLAEYVLCLGYACLVVPSLIKSLPAHLILQEVDQRTVVTGFDEGDNVLLGQVKTLGWIPSSLP